MVYYLDDIGKLPKSIRDSSGVSRTVLWIWTGL